jgi:hypothetical protein
MRVTIEKYTTMPRKEKYMTGYSWHLMVLPFIEIHYIPYDYEDSIDGYRIGEKEAFARVELGWLFWGLSFIIENIWD